MARPGRTCCPGFRYIQPSDQNPDDRSLAAADLPNAVAPGQSIQLRVAWKAQVPRTFARTGGIGNYFFVAAVVPQARRLRGRRLERAPVLRQHRVLRRLRPLRRPPHGPPGLGGRRHRPRGVAHRRRHVHHPPLRAGRRARLRLDDEPGLRRVRRSGSSIPTLPPVTMRLLLQPEHRGQEDRHFAGDRRGAEVLRRVVRRLSLSRRSPSSIRRGRAIPAAWSTRRSSPPARSWLAPRGNRTSPRPSPCTKPVTSSGTASSPTTR